MFGIGLVEIAVALALLVLVVVLPEVGLRRAGRSVRVRREWRLVQLTRVAGLVIGGVLASLTPDGSGLGPAVLGLSLLLAVALGETVVRPRRPTGARSASLSPRRIRDYAYPHLARPVLLSSATTVSLVVTSLLVLSVDARTGYRLVRGCTTDLPVSPGPAAVSPALVALLVAVLVVGALAARQVVRRPRGMGLTTGDDDALRRRSLDVVIAAVGFATSLTGTAVVADLSTAAEYSTRGAGCIARAGWFELVETAGIIVVLLYLGLALYCVFEILGGKAVGPRRSRHHEPAGR